MFLTLAWMLFELDDLGVNVSDIDLDALVVYMNCEFWNQSAIGVQCKNNTCNFLKL